MASGTLSFKSDEITEILSQVKYSGEFLQTPPSEFKTRDLERGTRRLLSYELHCATLAEYLRVKRIPRGLRIRTRPTFFKEDKEFCEKFEQILNKCSIDLMTLTVTYLQAAIIKTKAEISSVEDQLRTTIPLEEYTQLQERITTTLDQQRKEMETKKRQKFLRDTEDYRLNRVYRWPDQARTYFSRRSSSRESSRASSDSDTHSQQRFEGTSSRSRGRRGQRGGINPPGTIRGNSGIITRSQMT